MPRSVTDMTQSSGWGFLGWGHIKTIANGTNWNRQTADQKANMGPIGEGIVVESIEEGFPGGGQGERLLAPPAIPPESRQTVGPVAT